MSRMLSNSTLHVSRLNILFSCGFSWFQHWGSHFMNSPRKTAFIGYPTYYLIFFSSTVFPKLNRSLSPITRSTIPVFTYYLSWNQPTIFFNFTSSYAKISLKPCQLYFLLLHIKINTKLLKCVKIVLNTYCTYNLPCMVLSTLQILIHLILKTTQWEENWYHLYNEEIEAQWS